MSLTTSDDTVKFVRAIGINMQDWMKILSTKLSDDVPEVVYDNIRLFPLRYNDRIKAEKELATFFCRAEADDFPVDVPDFPADVPMDEGEIEFLSKYHPWANKGWAMSIYDLIDLYVNDIGFKAIPYTEISPKDEFVLDRMTEFASDQLFNCYGIMMDKSFSEGLTVTGVGISPSINDVGEFLPYNIIGTLDKPLRFKEGTQQFKIFFNETGNQGVVSRVRS